MSDPFIIIWTIVLICSVIIETSTLALISIWFAAGSVVAIIISRFGFSMYAQLLGCLITAGLLIVFVTPKLRKYLQKSKKPTNTDRIIGMEGIVTEDINEIEGKGQIKVAGAIWSAKSTDGAAIGSGNRVIVRKIEGVKAIVEPKKNIKEE